MLWGEMSVGKNVCGAKCLGSRCPWGVLSMGRNVPGASCPWSELSLEQNYYGAKCHGAISMGQVVNGASFDGASCMEIANPLSRHIPLIRKFFVSPLNSELAISRTY